MYKLNLIAVLGIVAAVSLAVVGMAASAAFATTGIFETSCYGCGLMANQMGLTDNMTMNTGNIISLGNMTGGGSNATSMAETESLPTANQTAFVCPDGNWDYYGSCPGSNN